VSGAFIEFPHGSTERSIPEMFEAQVRRAPDRVALRTPDESLTYRELNEAANRIAHGLLERVQDGRVALLLDSGTGFVTASLGGVKAGVVQVPMDMHHPRARLAYVLEQSGAQVVVARERDAALAREIVGPGRPVITLEALDAHGSSANPVRALGPDTHVAIEYTSGSTGHPKGILRNHRGVLHDVLRHTNMSRLCADDRLLLPGRGMVNHLHALLNGAAFYSVERQPDVLARLGDWIVSERVTVFRGPVSVFRAFAGALTGVERFPDLRLIELFGEPVFERDVDLHRKHFGDDCLLVSTLGTSEYGDFAHFFVDGRRAVPGGVVPAGYPAQDIEIVLLDEDGAPVGPGAVGEIAIRSRYGAAGYWQMPEVTAAAFGPVEDDGRRLYRTGDVGRIGDDGCLFHLGRRDFQVKINGNRVHVSEVEAALLEHEAVQATAVIGQELEPGRTRLVAYVVPRGPEPPTVSGLRQVVASRLPAFMVPTAFVMLDAFPRTATGKIDRRALPPPDDTRPALDTAYVEPSGPLEEALGAIYGRVLGVTRVGADDSFFELGGHSLLALRLVTEIDRELGRRLPLAVLLEAPSVRALAVILGAKDWSPPWSSLVAIQPRGERQPIFCVPGHSGTILCFQELAQQLGPEQPLYGLEPRGLDGRFTPQSSVEEMAAAYLEEIRGFQPTGPYCLAGYCFGGLVAYEMARRLRQAGQVVAVLALFDADAPTDVGPAWGSHGLRRVSARLRVEYANLAALSGRGRVAYARAQLDRAGDKLAGVLGRRLPAEDDHLIGQVAQAQTLAARDYRPSSYDGAMVVYKAQHPLTHHFVDPWFGWRPLVGEGLEVRLIRSSGGSIIQDPAGAAAVAADLRRRMSALDAAEAQPTRGRSS
jgi:amino acid adenylation domain-containing protein